MRLGPPEASVCLLGHRKRRRWLPARFQLNSHTVPKVKVNTWSATAKSLSCENFMVVPMTALQKDVPLGPAIDNPQKASMQETCHGEDLVTNFVCIRLNKRAPKQCSHPSELRGGIARGAIHLRYSTPRLGSYTDMRYRTKFLPLLSPVL